MTHTHPDTPAGRFKVLHLITRLITGGAQDNTLLTAERHDRDRYEVHVASGPDGELVDRAREVADAFHPISHLVNPISPLDDARALAEIAGLMRRERFDIVHTHSSKAGYLGRIAAKLAGVPVVVHTIHGSPFHPMQPAWKRGLFINLERSVRPLADAILTLSDSDRAEFVERGIVYPDQSQTVYTGMAPETLSPTPGRTRADTRAEIGVPDDAPVILMVGRHDRQKAPDLLARAFAQVVETVPDAVLVYAGDGPIRNEVEALVAELGVAGQVRFLGTRTDVPDLLVAADVFSFSSVREAMGRAMLEAMLAGLAVVVPRTSGVPEAAIDGETGVLFEVGDVDGLAAGLIRVLTDSEERRVLGEHARSHVLDRFGADTMVTDIEAVYERLLSSKAPAGRER